MAGIYIHIPFCKQACHYCNFHFVTSRNYENEFIGALLKEIELTSQEDHFLDKIETIYFGGGTPSLLHEDKLKLILDQINKHYSITPDAEITLEANPDDINADSLSQWKNAGINRLSIGVQSFFEEDLVWMNRAHHAKQAVISLEEATREFQNISIDLIYGTPGLTNEKWKKNVETAIGFGIPHLSCYALTVEPKTPLAKHIQQNIKDDVNPDQQAEQFELLTNWLQDKGYEHYEISNFALPGFRSRHNTSYWQEKKYLGLGPSAHSYDGNIRWWNVRNNKKYIDAIQQNELPREKEILTPQQKINEYIMISLRTSEGIAKQKLDEKLSLLNGKERSRFEKKLLNYPVELLHQDDNSIRLTSKGKFLADGIAADLFVDT